MVGQQITLLIPVFNSPHCVKDLTTTLILNTNPQLLHEVIIGDDASDELTKSLITEFVANAPFKVRVITHSNNKGYLANTNHLYKSATTEIVVFLNTDTLVPPQWLERIQNAFIADEKIILATPFSTNATNLSIYPNQGQTWLDIDRGLQTFSARYPDAHTAVGFCLAVRKNSWNEGELFDTNYHLGYWEETDLHYRVLSKGLRSVVIDDLLVYHAKDSSSFSTFANRVAISDENKKIFDAKWQEIHAQKEQQYLRQQPYEYLRHEKRFAYQETKQEIDILFVLPAFISASGGIAIVIEFIKYLTMHNTKASLIVEGLVDEAHIDFLSLINPWRSIAELKNYATKVKAVFATSHGSVATARKISEYFNATLGCLVQGPETLFSCGQNYAQTIYDYQNVQSLYCISKFLVKYLSQLGAAHPIYLPLGADDLKFYPNPGCERNLKAIAVCLRTAESKGTGEALYVLQFAKQAGFELHFFGHHSEHFSLPQNFGENHGDLNSQQLRKLLNRVGYYLDLSYFEGLGLLSLEAASCGAIPIIAHNGGADHVFVDEKNAFFLANIFLEDKFFEHLQQYTPEKIEQIRLAALELSKQLSLRKATAEFLLQTRHLVAEKSFQQVPRLVRMPTSTLAPRKSLVQKILSKLYQRYKHYISKIARKMTEDVSDQVAVLHNEILEQRKLLERLSNRISNDKFSK